MQTPAQKAVLDRLTALRARTGRPGAAANDGLTAALPAGERAQPVALLGRLGHAAARLPPRHRR